jgi:ABC-2 type transport system permease protein
MAAEFLRRGLRDHRRALVAWCVGIAGYIGLVSAIFPSIHNSPALDKLVENYPDVLKQFFGLGQGGGINTGSGYLDIELFSLMLPLLILVLAIGAGARTLAGEEDAGRLELVLAYPVRRSGAVVAKAAAVAVEIVVACIAAGIALAVLDPLVGLDLSFGKLLGALVMLTALGLLHGWLALSVGAAVSSRTLAIGVPAGLAATGYLVNGLHGLAGWLDPFRVVSPFWLVGTAPLRQGVQGWGLAAVLIASVAVLAAGAILVERRDLQTP